MGYARIRISDRLLVEALHLPPDTHFVAAKLNLDTNCDLELVVSHPDLVGGPAPGVEAPLACPSFRQQEPIVFEGWNQK